MFKRTARRQIFIDRPVQGTLISRIVLYWLLGMFIQALLIMLLSATSGEGDELMQRAQQFWWHVRLIVISSLVTLPLLVLDITRLSHRWVGPIYRLRTALQALARGDEVKPIAFRYGDFWKELADDFNGVLRRIDHLTKANDQPTEVDESEPVAS